jgi:hypothetical protein
VSCTIADGPHSSNASMATRAFLPILGVGSLIPGGNVMRLPTICAAMLALAAGGAFAQESRL